MLRTYSDFTSAVNGYDRLALAWDAMAFSYVKGSEQRAKAESNASTWRKKKEELFSKYPPFATLYRLNTERATR